MKKIGMIGCGNMGQAILGGVIRDKVVSSRNIIVSDVNSAKLNRVKRIFNVEATFNNSIVAKGCDVIIIAVKPQNMNSALNSISEYLDRTKLVISAAAGVTVKKMRSIAGDKARIARAMPNAPALIGEGMTAIHTAGLSGEQRKLVRNIFESLGEVVEIKEKDFDAVTAISGSGPTYFFYLVEILIKSGISFGLKRDVAEKLAVKTARGSAELLSRTGKDAGILRKRVTSKGGTTEAAFKLFHKRHLEKILRDGIKKARDRSRQLAGG